MQLYNPLYERELEIIKKTELNRLETLKKIRSKLDFVKKGHSQELEMYKKIVEHMSESIWIGDKDERTVYANPNFCKLLGYSLEEMIGRESYDFRDEESSRTVANNNEIRKEGEASKYEGVLKAKDGTLIPVLCSGTPIPGGGTVGIMTDLREMKSLKKVEEDLKQLNKVKDEFISIVGHELRTPLTIVKGYLNMVLDGDMGEINDNIKQALTASYESSAAMIMLINDMLDLSKIESGNMQYYDEKLNIVDFSQKLYQDLDIIAKEKEINLRFTIDGEFKKNEITIDPGKLKQTLINLINNALKFTNKGGYVDFRIKDLGKTLVFEVEDTGIGISEEKIHKIFDKFFQVDSYKHRTVEGLGLGLAISQRIIKHYDSKIDVNSVEGVGTKFYFELKK
ncbi:MAG: PAS domain-containing sensor histidine kinase [Candidatus Gracilibacteria bacterium]|nr:PAS domain-containing sensor histidine kinase [Candidatus Gracilibacteria bacterium]